jgi:membrane associated rhomboid family serine protease
MSEYRPTGFNVLPPVIKNLLILNGLFYLATFAFQQMRIDLVDLLGLHYIGAEKFKLYQFITYMFLHSPENIFHILLNMLALWMFGSPIENYWGGKRFLQFYLFCGIGAAITHYAIFYYQSSNVFNLINTYVQAPDINNFESLLAQLPKLSKEAVSDHLEVLFNQLRNAHTIQESQALSIELLKQYQIDYLNLPVIIGASGAIFGILLAFGMTFPETRIIMLFFPVPLKAKYAVIFYGGLELLEGVWNREGDDVAHFAHLGGMLFGFILIKIWQRSRRF